MDIGVDGKRVYAATGGRSFDPHKPGAYIDSLKIGLKTGETAKSS